jgi:hypothetical protein
MNIEIPSYPTLKKEPVTLHVDPVARSIAKPDAFMKPGTIGKPTGRGSPSTRIRLTNEKKIGRPRKRKRDYRDVQYL